MQRPHPLAAESAAIVFKGAVESLRKSTDGMLKAAKKSDREGYATHDLDFHRAIVSTAGNRTLLVIWESLAFEARTWLTLARSKRDWAAIASWHSKIGDELEAGDGANAGRLLEEHARR